MAQETPDVAKREQEVRKQDELRALQEGQVESNNAVMDSTTVHFPTWPTSKHGPMSTPPPPGMRPVNAIRREQVAEVNYNQVTGEPADAHPLRANPDETWTGPTGFDQPLTGQELLRRRKPRIE